MYVGFYHRLRGLSYPNPCIIRISMDWDSYVIRGEVLIHLHSLFYLEVWFQTVIELVPELRLVLQVQLSG